MASLDVGEPRSSFSKGEPNKNNAGTDKIVIRDFVVEAFIGVFEHEKKARQDVVINLELDIAVLPKHDNYELGNIVRYDLICAEIKALIDKGHIDLVETMAEDLAGICLSHERCRGVKVSVLKPNAIESAGGVGVEIYRSAMAS